jgi:hypothetical protein
LYIGFNKFELLKIFKVRILVVPKKNKNKPIDNNKKQEVKALNKVYFKPDSIDNLVKFDAIKLVKTKVKPSMHK